MATYLLHLAQGGDPRSHPHAEEYSQRRKAIEGETVQGSMFPDIVPETDQFGGAVTGDPERSERGTALFRGDPTERPHHLTLDAEARRQKKISDKRKANAPGEPYRSAYRYRLERAVADKKDRDARQAANQQRVSDGTLHPKIDEWLKKLVYDKKKNYAREYALARQSGSEIPQTPAGLKEEHAQKAREGIEKIIERHKIL
jgi:hypothetical protein